MENPLPKLFAQWKEKFVSWRPTVNDLSEDYRSFSSDVRSFFRPSAKPTQSMIWLFLFVAGIAFGAGLKALSDGYLTIGHEDYRLVPTERLYALNELREQALEDGATLPVNEKKRYPACGLESDETEL